MPNKCHHLQPKNIKVDKAKSAISCLCLHVKNITKTDDVRDCVNADWMVYISESNVVTLPLAFDTSGDICAYWQKVSVIPNGNGSKKYANYSRSNAIPECGFFVNSVMSEKDSDTTAATATRET